MERCKTLINKLLEQSEANAAPAAMLVTVQLLQAELSKLIADAPRQTAYSSVSVVLPVYNKRVEVNEPAVNEIKPVEEEKQEVPSEVPAFSKEEPEIPLDVPALPKEEPAKIVWMPDPVLETPTLAHQDEIKELNQKIGLSNGQSLNERLKTSKTEIGSFLTDVPVRDLKKAIGVNDRFVFLGELFRGDIDMYERSIKTINNFRILPEAEYWIERELKIKLGWDDSAETVQHFNQLVRRRFS